MAIPILYSLKSDVITVSIHSHQLAQNICFIFELVFFLTNWNSEIAVDNVYPKPLIHGLVM